MAAGDRRTAVRVVAWNANQGLARKADRLLALRPDIAVVAECAEAVELDGLERVGWTGSNRHKGLGVFARPELDGSVDPSWDPGREWFLPVRFDAFGLDLLAVWAMNHRAGEGGKKGRTHRALEHYAPFLARRRAVVAGDFNDNVRWDTRTYPAFAHTTALLANAGYANVYYARTSEEPGAESIGSLYFYRHADRPYLIDHAFVPEAWLPAVEQFWLGAPGEWLDLSDHVPLVLELGLLAVPTQVAHELGGYPKDATLPPYRALLRARSERTSRVPSAPAATMCPCR